MLIIYKQGKVNSFIKYHLPFCTFGDMDILKNAFRIVWRIWFYVLVLVPIIILFPFLLIFISKEKWYPYFFSLSRIWAKFILFGCGFYYKTEFEEELNPHKSYMFVANHTSMIDIMLMLAIIKNPFVFVGKKELVKIPLFGFFYKRACIMVDRSDSRSRRKVYARAQKKIDQGLSICIFPEGGVPEDMSMVLDKFKEGAFKLAIEYQIPIVPITFPDNKKRFSYNFFSGCPGLMRAKVHHFVETEGMTIENKQQLSENVREIILNQLLEFEKKKF